MKRIFKWGIVIFLVFCLLCGVVEMLSVSDASAELPDDDLSWLLGMTVEEAAKTLETPADNPYRKLHGAIRKHGEDAAIETTWFDTTDFRIDNGAELGCNANRYICTATIKNGSSKTLYGISCGDTKPDAAKRMKQLGAVLTREEDHGVPLGLQQSYSFSISGSVSVSVSLFFDPNAKKVNQIAAVILPAE